MLKIFYGALVAGAILTHLSAAGGGGDMFEFAEEVG
jgi:hypothetical protein